ncbi:MAG: CaiB/BaiF CoA-transferase family protein [Alphaproteobacteria bacterium]
MAKAFDGLRVIDLSQVIAGPFCAEQLAFLGADVIKVESPGSGDQARSMMTSRAFASKGLSPLFITCNAGKRSMTLDLKHPRATEIVHRLVASADVMIQNLKVGTIERMGFGYADMKKVKPDLVYCSISGYGQSGPKAANAAFDGAIQAESGIMSITGRDDTGPTRAGYMVVDVSTGLMAAFAIAAALYRRKATGEGQFIDVAMMDTALNIMAPIVSNYLMTGDVPALYPTGERTRLASDVAYETKDGYLQCTLWTEPHFKALSTEIGRPELADDSRFVNMAARAENAWALRQILMPAFRTDTAANWESRLGRRGIPASRVASVPDALATPQSCHRGLTTTLPPPKGLDRPIQVLKPGYRTDVDPPEPARTVPAVGEHTDAILAEIGYSAAEIAAIRGDGAV